ncbi:MAG TPA: ABC-F family ATP-binding cassette domain-containing protein [Roseiflexaceae bacterium]|nr:ABC-F family ATP-binding cassette domain-containing protein [Roseiflexaceae bacterium]
MVILSLESIAKQYADRPLLEGVTLAVEAGERVGVVGVNGSGKTTLLRIAAGAEVPDDGRISRARDQRLAYLPQNPALDSELTVIEQIFRGDTPEMQLLRDYEQAAATLARAPGDTLLQQQVAALITRMDAAGAWGLENDARTILSRLGIADLTGRRIVELSGGQRKRVAMAAALVAPADLLILDEPTNHIDVGTVAWLESFLLRTNAALLLVTHDRYFLNRVVGRIVELEAGKLYSYAGNYSRFLEQKAERAAQQAVDEARRQTILKKELTWLRRGAQARTTKQQARIDRIAAMQAAAPEAARGELELSSVSRRLGKRVIELKGVGKGYEGRSLIRDLSLTIGPRDRLGIVGPNGSGKTTLLNLIAGRTQPDTGAIDIGATVHIAYYDQESVGLDETQRVIDYIREGAELVQTAQGALVSAAQMLERFLFPSAAHYTPIGRLSGGERRRLYLLRTLMAAPNVLLLDEPTNDLDIQTLAILEDYLDDFAGALIVVSHDRYFLDRTAEHLLAFEGDSLVVEYPGSYSYYAEVTTERAADEMSPAERSKPKVTPQSPPTRPRKLSFKDQRELNELEGRIADLESTQADLAARVNAAAGGDYQELLRLTAELERVGGELESAVERWAELAEIAEGA